MLRGLRAAFPDLQLSASDAMSGGLAIARARVPDARLELQDARELDAARRYDVVCAFDVLEHIAEDRDVLARLHRAAVAGGGLIITVPQHPWLWSRADEYGHHVRRYRRNELVAFVRDVGFEPLRITSFVSLLLPLLAVSRWRERRRTGPLHHRETRPPVAINHALRAILNLERQAIRMGISLPAGGSLLLVARTVTDAPHA